MNQKQILAAVEAMENNLYGIYDAVNDKPNYLRHSVDDQYNNNVRLGAMLNFEHNIMKKIQEVSAEMELFSDYIKKQCEIQRMYKANKYR